MKKKNFNEVRDSYNNDFKKERKTEGEPKEILAKDNILSYNSGYK